MTTYRVRITQRVEIVTEIEAESALEVLEIVESGDYPEGRQHVAESRTLVHDPDTNEIVADSGLS